MLNQYLVKFGKKNIFLFCCLLFVYQNFLIIFSSIEGDEIFGIQLKGLNLNLNYDILEYVLRETIFWLIQGDTSPLSTLQQIIFYYYFQDPLTIKLFYLFLLFISVFVFYLFIKINIQNEYFALTFFLIISVFFQYQLWHDAFLIFPLYVIPHFILLITSLICYSLFLKKNDNNYKVFSIILLLIAFCYTTISTVPIIPAYFLLLFHYKKKINIKELKEILIISAIFVFIVIYFKFFFNNESYLFDLLNNIQNREINYNYDGRILEFNPILNIYTLIIQTFGSLPISTFFRGEGFTFKFYDLIYLISFFCILKFFLSKFNRITDNNLNFLFYFALILIISAAPVSLSQKYIDQLINKGFGFSYIYVFFQYFGMALFFLIFFKKFKVNTNIFCILISVLALITITSNRTIVETNSVTKNYDISLIKKAAKKNFFSEVGEFSNVYFENSLISNLNSPQFLSTHLNKNIFSNYYSIRLTDYVLVDKVIKLKKSKFSKNFYLLNNLQVKNIESNRYLIEKKNRNLAFNVASPELRNLKKNIIVFNDKEKKQILNNSDNLFYLKTLITKNDHILILSKINEIIIVDNRISDFISNNTKIFSKKKNTIEKVKGEIYLTNLKNKLEKYFKHKNRKKIEIDNFFYKSTNPIFENKSTLYSGSMNCSLKKINLKKNTFFNLLDLNNVDQDDYLSIVINNNSEYDWRLNKFDLNNPITIRSIIFDDNKKSYPGPGFTDYFYLVKKGQQIEININYLKLNEMIKKILKYNSASYILIDLVHEGKSFFHKKGFIPCKINII